MISISCNDKISLIRTGNNEKAQLARHTLKNLGPITEISFTPQGQLLIISVEEMSSHFRKMDPKTLVWENFEREEICEGIAGFWSESGLAISSFMPIENKLKTANFNKRPGFVSLIGNGSLYDIKEKEEEEKNSNLILEIPLQNANHWKNNLRGLNFVFSDNKLIVFKVKK